jgi:putative nucleotidyltransferase with HDIG domain
MPAPRTGNGAVAVTEPHEHPGQFGRRDAARLLIATLLIVAALVGGVAIDLAPPARGYTAGSIAATTIRAPRTAVIPNPVETLQEQEAARAAVAPIYDYTAERAVSIADARVAELRLDLRPVDQAFEGNKAPEARRIELQAALPSLTSGARTTLLALDAARWAVLADAAEQVLESGEREEIRDTNLTERRTSLIGQYMPIGLSEDEQRLVTEIVTPLFVANSSYSEALTQQARDRAASAVMPVQDTIQAGQVIVDEGHPISESEMVRLRYFGLDASHVELGKPAAWLLLGALVAALMFGWIWRNRPEYWHRTRTLVLIGLVFVVAALALKLPAGRAWLPYLVPTVAAGMLLAVLLDASVGILVLALLSVLAGMVNGSSLEVSAYTFLGGLAGILVIHKGERQHYFLQAGVLMAGAGMAVIGVFTLLGQHDMAGMFQLWGASFGAAVIAAVVTLGSFAVLGNIFGILTSSQLLELANPSQPLLRRLLTETPGTYHHSLMVGNLGERAASAIGADPLLTRVAAYYHDVGKLDNPGAFIENQAGGDNVHDQLSPAASAAILKQHVAEGIDLAYKARLPKSLIAFIPQHHGTAVLSFFYAKAREAAAEPRGGLKTAAGREAADKVDQRPFRHAGPKPQSKEAAVLMLADGVEASVRSLTSRDEATIRAMVAQIIQERLSDGQLNECDITIRDLEKVQDAFVEQLLGMYHQRIAYPQNKIVELESRRERGLG